MVRLSFNNRERPEKPWRRDCLVVSLAVGIIGVTFGVFAESAGFGLAEIFVMSALVFTGASQFAAVGVVEGGGSGGAAVGSALLLATRNALYGPVVRRVLPKARVARLASAHFVIDETAAMSVSQANLQASRDAFWFTGVLLWLLWNAGSLAGAVIGSALSSPETLGLDAAFPAIYLALIAGHVRTFAGRVAAICAALITLASLPFVASGLPILLSVLALVPAMFALRRTPPASATPSPREKT